jgi:prefoldin subunit 5
MDDVHVKLITEEIEKLRAEIAELRLENKGLRNSIETVKQSAKIEMQALRGQQHLNFRYNERT